MDRGHSKVGTEGQCIAGMQVCIVEAYHAAIQAAFGDQPLSELVEILEEDED